MAIVKFLSFFLYSFSFNIFSINYDGSLHNVKLKLSGSHRPALGIMRPGAVQKNEAFYYLFLFFLNH
jgi:hypothetical protein